MREAAKLTTFSRTTWTSLETGTRIKEGGGVHAPAKPRPDTIMQAARVVGVDVNEALTLGGWDPRVYNPDYAATRLEQRLALLSPEQQAAVGWVVDAFLAAEVPAQAQEAVAGVIAAYLSADVPQQVTQEPPKQTRRGARMSGARPGRRHAVMSHGSRHDEEAATPENNIPESRRAESRT